MRFEHQGREAGLALIEPVDLHRRQLQVLFQSTDYFKPQDLMRLRYLDDGTYFYTAKNELKPLDEEASLFLVRYKLGVEEEEP